jgi:protein-tyrosine-phosphatase
VSTKVLVVCGGNTCRSPMAEGMAASLARTAGIPDGCISVASAGVSAYDGEPASQNAVAAMAELGIDISAHRSRRLTPELIDDADLVLTMEQRHLEAVIKMAPAARTRVRLLADDDIADPFMLSVDAYRHTRDQIAEALSRVFRDLGDRGACE